MSVVEFGDIAGFVQGPAASQAASVVPTAEAIATLKSRGVTIEAIEAVKKIYDLAALNPNNFAAIQREALLTNLLKAY